MKKAGNYLNAEASVTTPIKVAVIDDEAPMRRALARLMKNGGHRGYYLLIAV
jgi:hypothetical protein